MTGSQGRWQVAGVRPGTIETGRGFSIPFAANMTVMVVVVVADAANAL